MLILIHERSVSGHYSVSGFVDSKIQFTTTILLQPGQLLNDRLKHIAKTFCTDKPDLTQVSYWNAMKLEREVISTDQL